LRQKILCRDVCFMTVDHISIQYLIKNPDVSMLLQLLF